MRKPLKPLNGPYTTRRDGSMGILAAARSSTCTIRFEMPDPEPALSYQYVPDSDNQA